MQFFFFFEIPRMIPNSYWLLLSPVTSSWNWTANHTRHLAKWSNSQNHQAMFVSGFVTPNVLAIEYQIFQNWRKQETTYQGGTRERNTPTTESLPQIMFAYLVKQREKNPKMILKPKPFPKRQPGSGSLFQKQVWKVSDWFFSFSEQPWLFPESASSFSTKSYTLCPTSPTKPSF